MAGYIKDHRKELDSDIWLMPPLYHRVWQYLKYKANHAEAEVPLKGGGTLIVRPGQHFTSVRSIAKGVSWKERGVIKEPNPKLIGDILKWLEDQEMIVFEGVKSNTPSEKNGVKGNSIGTIITLINWEKYQFEAVTSNAKVTPSGVTSGTNNNNKDLNTTTTNEHACANESMNLPDELLGDYETKDRTNPFIQILDAYCKLHRKLDIHVKERERGFMRKFVGMGMPARFVIETMHKLYAAKKQREEDEEDGFRPPTSFTYYADAITEAWRAEQRSQTTPVPSGTVAQGTAPARIDKHLDARKRDIALNQWIDSGGDPNEFVYQHAGNH